MNISAIGQNIRPVKPVSFGRALTTAESNKRYDLIQQARKELGINDTYMICFDTSMPSEKNKNTGIGTSFSEAGKNFLKFMHKTTGITYQQDGPQGTITKGNRSPFSGSVFAIGEHLIDLNKLATDKYQNILDKNVLNGIYTQKDSKVSQFDDVLGNEGTQKQALKSAFNNFKKLDETSQLKSEYNNFINSQKTDWLERDSLYEALSTKHNSDYWKNWNDNLDKNLFSDKYSEEEKETRKNEIKSEFADTIEYNKFVQFIADKQQKETKKDLKDNGVKISGDCLIGFSSRENWAYQSAFKDNTYVGCPSWGGGIIEWGLPAIDYEKLGDVDNLGESGKLMKHKFDQFFERYDGARLDAAWQLVEPFIYKNDGTKPSEREHVGYLGDKIFKIMDKSAEEHKINKENLTCEMLGGPVPLTGGIMEGRTQIEHSIYQNHGWGSVNFYKSQGMKDNEFTFGLGTHDDFCLDEVAEYKRQEQADSLADNLKMFDRNLLKDHKSWFKRAKWAEIFTARNNFFTAFDALGLRVRFNDQGNNPMNWSARIPENYEEVYNKNLQKKKALNAPRALADALEIKGMKHNPLTKKLHKIASIMEEKGVLTEKEANEKYGENTCEI